MTDESAGFRDEVRGFLEHSLPSDWPGIGALSPSERDRFRGRWRQSMLEAGLLGVSWPREYGGRGLGVLEQAVVQEEFLRAGVPHLPFLWDLSGLILLGPTLLAWGTDEQKRHFLPRILSGEDRWCQGYSEPEAGSDLFALRTRAHLVGDDWVLNGQKIWTSHADQANWIFCLARTEPDIARAPGISFLLVPMDQPGVDVRPIRTMTGEAEFCEVFFTDARTRREDIVGGRGEGARVSLTLLEFERSVSASGKHIGYTIEFERLLRLIKSSGQDGDPLIRQKIARAYAQIQVMRFGGQAALQQVTEGGSMGPQASILKLLESEYHQFVTELAMETLGSRALVKQGLPGPGGIQADPLGTPNTVSAWQEQYLTARAKTIYGGSAQIQRNTIAERLLGMPRER